MNKEIEEIATEISDNSNNIFSIYNKEDIYQQCWLIGLNAIKGKVAFQRSGIKTLIKMRFKSWKRDQIWRSDIREELLK